MTNSDNAKLFLDAFNAIEEQLKRMTNLAVGTPFKHLVTTAAQFNPVVKRYEFDLNEFRELRNSLVHRGRHEVLAEPKDFVVKQLQAIEEMLRVPPKVYPMFSQQVATLSPTAPVAGALRIMYQRGFSQIPVYRRGSHFVGLLTASTITRWLGASVNEKTINLQATKLTEVLSYTDNKHDRCVFLARDSSIYDALQLFLDYDAAGKKLEAIIITNNGDSHEKPLGIITVSDLPKIHESLDLMV